jgi:hypothetical protein
MAESRHSPLEVLLKTNIRLMSWLAISGDLTPKSIWIVPEIKTPAG